MDPKVAQQRAQHLVDDANRNSGDRLSLYWKIDAIFLQERWAVRKATRENPDFERIVDGAVCALIDVCIEKAESRDKLISYLCNAAMNSHPELAAAYVLSAARILGERGFRCGAVDLPLRKLGAHIAHSDERDQHLVSEANKALKRLKAMIAKPGAK